MAARPPLPLRPSAQQITDARDEEILPFDGAAFWERLCQEIERRVPVCGSPDRCRQWLAKELRGTSPRTFQRWSTGTRPRWEQVRSVCKALGKIEGAAPITEVELTIDLPLHRGPDTDEAGARCLTSSATEPTTPPPGPTSAPRALREPSTDEPFADDLAALRDKLEALLQRARFLTEALAEALDLSDAPGDLSARLAEALLHTPGKDIADALATLDGTLDRDRDALRSLFWEILPLTVEWRRLVVDTRAALRSGVGSLELPLRTETVAEIVLAGAEGRPCQFAPGAVIPEGVGHVALPAVAHAPFFDGKGELLVQAVVMNLGKEGELGEKIWGPYLKKYPRYPDFKTIVDRKLKASKKDGSAHYLLVIDAILDPDQKRDVDTSWGIARVAFDRDLPGLRLVRLTGRSPEALGEEFDFADPIKKIRDAQ